MTGYVPVWYISAAIANILTLSLVQARFPVTYDEDTGSFLVKPRGQINKFKETYEGLYFINCLEVVVFVNTKN